ncbi:MAG: RNA polymerase sigma factor [Bacteroidia bacterium]
MTTNHNIPAAERALISLLKSKNKEVIEILYDRYGGALLGVAEKIMKSEALGEDVLQEAFVKIWLNAESYDSSKGRLFTWMLNITRNLAIDKLKSKHYKQSLQTDSAEAAMNVSENNDSDSILGEEGIGLQEVLNQLKPDQRQLIELMYFSGYTQAEISEELNMPLGTVKTKMRAAMLVLRKHYGVEVGVMISLILKNFI